jgi:hypothetical protein
MLLQGRGSRQKIVDVFSVTDFHNQKGRALGRKEVTEMRKREDLENAAKTNSSIEFLDFPDAKLRGYAEMRRDPDWKRDGRFAREIESRVRPMLKTARRVFFPLAVGKHVDHIIVSSAGVGLLLKTKSDRIYFYEDLPYIIRPKHPYYLIDIENEADRLRSRLIKFPCRSKWELCSSYRSVFTGIKVMPRLTMLHARRLGHLVGCYERVWKVADVGYYGKKYRAERGY